MALTIIPPNKTVNGMSTSLVAARSQILYLMSRQDYGVNFVQDVGGFARFHFYIAEGDVTSEFTNGDLIYVGVSSLYATIGTVTSIAFTASETRIATDIPFNGSFSGYMNNLTARSAYHIAVDIIDFNSTTAINSTPLKYVPNQAGNLSMDLSGVISGVMSDPDNTTFSFLYYLEVTEVWQGSSELPTSTTTTQAILGQKQILKTGGALMWENLLRQAGIATDGTLGETLDKFTSPVKWKGWNALANAAVDSLFNARTGFSTIEWVGNDIDINKQTIGATFASAFGSIDPTTYTFTIPEPVEPNTAFISLLVREADSNFEFLSKILYYEIRDECDNPIMLDWINTSGGVSNWLFTQNQAVVETVGQGVVVERPITSDIEFITNTKRRFPGATVQRITMEASHLTQDQLDALKEIKETQSLRVYLTKDGTEFVDAIVVNDLTVEYQTKEVRFDFRVTIEFPDDFNFFDAKKY